MRTHPCRHVCDSRPAVRRHSAWRFLLASSAAVCIGCSGGVPPPDISKEPYAGPPLSLQEWDGRQMVVANPPHAGFRVRIDRVLDGWGHQSAYITIREPDPAFTFTPAPVVQRIQTNVHTTTPLLVFARVEDFTGNSPIGAAYSPVRIEPLALSTPSQSPAVKAP